MVVGGDGPDALVARPSSDELRGKGGGVSKAEPDNKAVDVGDADGEPWPRMGLGLLLLRLPIGLANPLPACLWGWRASNVVGEGATTATSSSAGREEVMTSAALSRTEGTACSSCSVALARGIRCGLGGCVGGEGGRIGSMSRSNMAEEAECA